MSVLPRSATAANSWWATSTTIAPMVRATRISTRVKPPSRRICRLPPKYHRHQILHLRRAPLQNRDPIQRALRPLDVRDELADRVATKLPIKLVPFQQRQCSECALLRRKDSLPLAPIGFGPQPGGHQIEHGYPS